MVSHNTRPINSLGQPLPKGIQLRLPFKPSPDAMRLAVLHRLGYNVSTIQNDTAPGGNPAAVPDTIREGRSRMAYNHRTPTAVGLTTSPASEPLADLRETLDSIPDEAIVARMNAYRPTGRPGYDQRVMWRAYAASFLLNLPHTNGLIRQLHVSPALRDLCGFDSELPSRRTFNRFIQRLADHIDLVEDCFTQLTSSLKEELPDLGQEVAIDATAVRTHSNPNKAKEGRPPSDPDAAWGVKHSAKSKSKDSTEYFFGHKVHMVADAKYGLPLAFRVTPGNESDSPELPKIMMKAYDKFDWFKPTVAMADRGYDAADNFKYLYGKKVDPIIHIRKPTAHDGLYDGVYNKDLLPLCLGNVPMEYVGTTGDGEYVYRCMSGGCHLKESNKGGILHCDTVFAEDPTVSPELMRILGPITRRNSPKWKELYAKRWSVERLFKTLKESRRLETHCVRGAAHIALHSIMATLTYQSSALVKVRAGDKESMRWMVRKVA